MGTDEAEEIIGYLTTCNFGKLWKDEELRDFYVFMLEQGIPAGGFLITIPMFLTDSDDPEDRGYVWFLYEVQLVQGDGKARLAVKAQNVFIPTQRNALRDKPKDIKAYPVYRYQAKK